MIALDTNILIYACDKADPSRQQIALDLVSNAFDGILLWQVACEFVAASRKLKHQGFTTADAWNRLADYQSIISAHFARFRGTGTSSRSPRRRRMVVLGLSPASAYSSPPDR
jgi:predicted nucleic acid-binding protein